MELVIKKPVAPPGRHRMVLSGVQSIPGNYGKAALEFAFVVVGSGPAAGSELTKVTGTDPRVNLELGKFVSQLCGRALAVGEAIDLAADLVGREFDVFATPASGGGGSVIRTVTPAAAAPAVPPLPTK